MIAVHANPPETITWDTLEREYRLIYYADKSGVFEYDGSPQSRFALPKPVHDLTLFEFGDNIASVISQCNEARENTPHVKIVKLSEIGESWSPRDHIQPFAHIAPNGYKELPL